MAIFPLAPRAVSCRGYGILPKARAMRSLLVPLRFATPALTRAMSAQDQSAQPLFTELSDIIHPNLLRGITDMGYDRMTPVQAMTIRPALEGKDIVAQAKTGTGKTIGFLLPILQRMILEDASLASRSASYDAESSDIRGIVISPTRELAEQIAEEARRITTHTGLVIQSAVGGTMKRQMLQKTRAEGCHLLVATPGRLNDLLMDTSSNIAAPNLAAMVLDEADRILDVGFMPQVEEIQRYLPSRSEKERQTMLFSATIPHGVVGLARSLVRADQFDFIQTISEDDIPTHERVKQVVCPVQGYVNIFPSLLELIEKESKTSMEELGMPFKAIVYFNYTAMVKLAISFLWEAGFRSSRFARDAREGAPIQSFGIHSGLTQPARTRAAEQFRHAKSGLLVSSDVTARGMDFPNVSHVIQIDLPRTQDNYIHRIGRTGRQEKPGKAWSFVPSFGMREARHVFRGLPVEMNESLECAKCILSDIDQMPPLFKQALETFRKIDPEEKDDAYRAMIGQISSLHGAIESLNEWSTAGWGNESPPTISSSMAGKLGIDSRQVNIGFVPRRETEFGSRGRSSGTSRFDSRSGNAGPRYEGSMGGQRQFNGDRPPYGGRPFFNARENLSVGSRESGGNRGRYEG